MLHNNIILHFNFMLHYSDYHVSWLNYWSMHRRQIESGSFQTKPSRKSSQEQAVSFKPPQKPLAAVKPYCGEKPAGVNVNMDLSVKCNGGSPLQCVSDARHQLVDEYRKHRISGGTPLCDDHQDSDCTMPYTSEQRSKRSVSTVLPGIDTSCDEHQCKRMKSVVDDTSRHHCIESREAMVCETPDCSSRSPDVVICPASEVVASDVLVDSTTHDSFDDCLQISNERDAILSYYYHDEQISNKLVVMKIFPLPKDNVSKSSGVQRHSLEVLPSRKLSHGSAPRQSLEIRPSRKLSYGSVASNSLGHPSRKVSFGSTPSPSQEQPSRNVFHASMPSQWQEIPSRKLSHGSTPSYSLEHTTRRKLSHGSMSIHPAEPSARRKVSQGSMSVEPRQIVVDHITITETT